MGTSCFSHLVLSDSFFGQIFAHFFQLITCHFLQRTKSRQSLLESLSFKTSYHCPSQYNFLFRIHEQQLCWRAMWFYTFLILQDLSWAISQHRSYKKLKMFSFLTQIGKKSTSYNIKHLETFLCKYTSEVQKCKWGKVEDLEVLQRGKKDALLRLDPWIIISLTYVTFITGKNLHFFDFHICTDKYSTAIIYHTSPEIILTSFLNTKQRVQNHPFSFSFKIVLAHEISTRSSNQVCTVKPICNIFLQ